MEENKNQDLKHNEDFIRMPKTTEFLHLPKLKSSLSHEEINKL